MPTDNPTPVHVVLLCAAWCGVCREMAPAFAELAQAHPDARFHWLDVEDEADLLDDLDVDNFPTVLLGVNGEPVFFGTILPHIQTLKRLVQDASTLPRLAPSAHEATLRQVLSAVGQRDPL